MKEKQDMSGTTSDEEKQVFCQTIRVLHNLAQAIKEPLHPCGPPPATFVAVDMAMSAIAGSMGIELQYLPPEGREVVIGLVNSIIGFLKMQSQQVLLGHSLSLNRNEPASMEEFGQKMRQEHRRFVGSFRDTDAG